MDSWTRASLLTCPAGRDPGDSPGPLPTVLQKRSEAGRALEFLISGNGMHRLPACHPSVRDCVCIVIAISIIVSLTWSYLHATQSLKWLGSDGTGVVGVPHPDLHRSARQLTEVREARSDPQAKEETRECHA